MTAARARLELHAEMKAHGIRPTPRTYSSLISAAGSALQLERACVGVGGGEWDAPP